ncbi:MAG: FAD-dependent oxidoreductase [Desulfobacterales bacterium]|nr:FAD-dependent oxidoreductase [Desulfobacterales bacterium]
MKKKIGKALVVGAGISGIRAALDLAETGYGVTLIDRATHMGGILSQLDAQFPTNHCGMCKMLPLVQRDRSSQFCLRKGLFHENIEILLNTEVADVAGEPGNFTVSLKEKPTGVDPARCIGCGVCEAVCPVCVPDAFNAGLATRKAIYLPVPHQIPNPYVIDPVACTRCGACVKVCPTEAIQLASEQRKAFRILVVDDEPIVRDSLKEWLEDEGFFVATAESGQAALALLAETPFHLMLTDIKMPGMDGVDLLKAAHETFPDLAVLMMTAYATVDTAVEAMKIGAQDYLIKPFDPEVMIPKIVGIYARMASGSHRQISVGAMVLCGGTDYFDPTDEKNVYGYGVFPGVITNLELERIISGTGPTGGKLIRPGDGKPVKKIAWLQCVGSRDIQCDADFCSSICCMIAVKEALLVKERSQDRVEAAIFYMDMRTPGKSFQRYRDSAQNDHGVRFERSRIHSLSPDSATGDPSVRYLRADGSLQEETFDLVVLSVGQRPSPGTQEIAEQTGIELNRWGFVQTNPFSPAHTARTGIFVGGSFSGPKDIGDSVITASDAALEASRVIHAAGGSLSDETEEAPTVRDVSREQPRVLVAICTCGNRYSHGVDPETWVRKLENDPSVERVIIIDQGCTAVGWDRLVEAAESSAANRIVLGACHPYLFVDRLKDLGRRIHLDPALMDVVDIMTPAITYHSQITDDSSQLTNSDDETEKDVQKRAADTLSAIAMAIARVKYADPLPTSKISITRKVLVVGGGIAGMHAALAIADHGYPVDLLEQTDRLGGNLNWLNRTLEGEPTAPLLEETVQRLEKHPQIDIHLQTEVQGAFGEVGHFFTTVSDHEGQVKTLEHGTVILATGGIEAPTQSYGYGTGRAVITQKELASQLDRDELDPAGLASVVMIQCVDSREEPRNYCSRVCCPTSLKHALALKEKNPEVSIYILYRDMMTPGFSESYFTQARRSGVIFVQYDVAHKPRVTFPQGPDGNPMVMVVDPLLDRPLEIDADLLVLATGIVPKLPAGLATAFGAETNEDGFFKEAESKWRPVDALMDGVFACGLALSPWSVADTLASAGAAAQRCLKILSNDHLSTGRIVSTVRPSLCSLCQRCIEACPYHARTLVLDLGRVAVNPAMCQGCGTCATVCPNGASVVVGYTKQQMFEVIDAALVR